MLGERHSFVLDSAGCRRLITTSCRIGGRPAPTNALQIVRAHAGEYRRVLVVAAGYNDPTTGSVGLDTAVEVMIATAHEQGIDHVIWLTYREAGESANRYRDHNALLRLKAAEHPELTIADWAARSAAMPRSWFSADGLHLGADAAEGMATLITGTRSMSCLPTSVPNTCPLDPAASPTRRRCSCLHCRRSPALGRSSTPPRLPEPARRLQLWCPS